jgi:hypothetical protein
MPQKEKKMTLTMNEIDGLKTTGGGKRRILIESPQFRKRHKLLNTQAIILSLKPVIRLRLLCMSMAGGIDVYLKYFKTRLESMSSGLHRRHYHCRHYRHAQN